MGKYLMLIVTAVMAGTGLLMYQAKQTSMDTDRRQTQRQEKVIARQIARTGYNTILAEARALERNGKKVNEIVSTVGTLEGEYQGGTYTARLEKISPTAYRAISEGRFVSTVSEIGALDSSDPDTITHKIEESHRNNSMPPANTPAVPEIADSSQLDITFTESNAGYCSAIYLQRFIKNNNGHGNNCDGVDSSNPGSSMEGADSDSTYDDECGQFSETVPELVFAPGNDRTGTNKTYSKVIPPGTRLNFIIAVDADYSCELEGDTTLAYDDPFYDYTRKSFSEDIVKFGKLHEAPYTLMQEKPGEPGTWRIAFEDLIFKERKLWDIKKRGYPDGSTTSWDKKKKTYHGAGWKTDTDGYYQLQDFGSIPDFSDQVIEVKVVPATGS